MRCDIDLDFDLVNDICLACQEAAITRADLPTSTAHQLGPLLELNHVAPRLDGVEINGTWLTAPGFDPLLAQIGGPRGWHANDMHQGIARVGELADDPLAWTAFVHRSRTGAANAGFSADHSAKLVAAIGEVYSNVIEHSDNVSSGYVAYRATSGQFEFVVADQGIGVLESLRTNPKYRSLKDSGAALELALERGTSRHLDSGHGFGFVPIFVGLANISRVVRFRSGDHARITVRERSGRITSATRESARCRGFFCSVLCDLQ
ncbi:hypothetical protein AMC87_PB00290 (plasmid) [Rhizobium phaseoli]|uniref:ATP-binding protein n=1 Tax=Rhizobium phaseoli TaxID=396 RepID=UPI0007EB446D|nr:ATP-binding protein [Rhizobium phaseoli]ANL49614.1 hypothetical protein AMC87_PB00290 [Rhizobium phaseoli]